MLEEMLRLYPFLQQMDGGERKRFVAHTQMQMLPAGSLLFQENRPCSGFVFVLQGGFRVFRRTPHGRELSLYRVRPGGSCSILSACVMGLANHAARGMTDEVSRLVLLPRSEFEAMLPSRWFNSYLFTLCSERMGDVIAQVESVSFHKLDQRLAALLLRCGPQISMTHQQLANETGSVREVVSRLLKRFANEGWVVLGREYVEVVNRDALVQLAGSIQAK